jgi:hypothetical protein
MKSGVNMGAPWDMTPSRPWAGARSCCDDPDAPGWEAPTGAPPGVSTRIALIARLIPPGVLNDSTERCFTRSPS